MCSKACWRCWASWAANAINEQRLRALIDAVHSSTLGAEKHLSSKDSGAFLLVVFIGGF
jgi:hypothetical protein